MKYINILQIQNEVQKKQLEEYEKGLMDIMRYLNSDKFHGIENNFVNPNDIILRINEKSVLKGWILLNTATGVDPDKMQNAATTA